MVQGRSRAGEGRRMIPGGGPGPPGPQDAQHAPNGPKMGGNNAARLRQMRYVYALTTFTRYVLSNSSWGPRFAPAATP